MKATKYQLEHRRKIHAAAIEASKVERCKDCATPAMCGLDGCCIILYAPRKGGKREGSGRKPKHGQPMKSRAIRWTDEQWSQVLAIGTDRLRELVATEYASIDHEQLARHNQPMQQDSTTATTKLVGEPARGSLESADA